MVKLVPSPSSSVEMIGIQEKSPYGGTVSNCSAEVRIEVYLPVVHPYSKYCSPHIQTL